MTVGFSSRSYTANMSIIDDVGSASNLDDALARIIAHFKADSGTIHLVEADGLLHLKAASKGLPEAVLNMVRTVPVGKGMAGLAVERREPITICNIQTDSSGDVRPGAKKTGMEGAIVVPIMRGEEVVGALGIANREERTFTPRETELLMECGRRIGHRQPKQALKDEPRRPF
jgi:L-methionine (R)-S-oxide reductase